MVRKLNYSSKSVKSLWVETLKLKKIREVFPKRLYIYIRPFTAALVVLLILSLWSFLAFKPKAGPKVEPLLQGEGVQGLQSTQEAKLKEVYQKEKNLTSFNYTPRYSVYEDSGIGFKVAYPVGFNPVMQDWGVKLISADGSVDVQVDKGTFQVKTSGAVNSKSSDILSTAADFVRGSFEFTNPEVFDRKSLKLRFSGNAGESHY